MLAASVRGQTNARNPLVDHPDPNDAADVEGLRTQLRELRRLLDAQLHEAHRRHVSFGDLIEDRWSRARQYGFGEGTSCYDSALVIGDVQVGRNTWIGPNTVLDGSGGLRIGDYCSISAGAQVYTHSSVEWSTSLGTAPVRRMPTTVGDGVYIGPGAIIQMGVSIGSRAVIGALTLVSADVPDGARCFGIPGRLH